MSAGESRDPGNWTSAGLGGREALTRRLTEAERDAIEAAADAVRDRPIPEIGCDDFGHPAIAALMAEVRRAVMDGAGAMILSGLDPRPDDLERFERIHWGLGTHLGRPTINGPAGDWVAHVHKSDDNPTGRGTLMDVELRPHTDFHEVMSLACLSRADQGGASALVSGPAVAAILEKEHPELVAPLRQGYWYGINETVGGDKPVSDDRVPVLSERAGRTSVFYNKFFMAAAARRRGEALPEALVKAMNAFDEIAVRDDVALKFMLEPGEVVFWHNWTCLHAREGFVDAPGRKRFLTRLWINVPDGRPVHPEVAARARLFDIDHFRAAGLEMPS